MKFSNTCHFRIIFVFYFSLPKSFLLPPSGFYCFISEKKTFVDLILILLIFSFVLHILYLFFSHQFTPDIFLISHIYCGQPTNLGFLGSLSVVSLSTSTVRLPVITNPRPMSEFGRVTVTTKLGQLSQNVTNFQLKQLDYGRSGDRTHDLKHRSMLTIPLVEI